MNMFLMPSDFVIPLAITVYKAGMVTCLVRTMLPFTRAKSNSESLRCDGFNIMVLKYANFQDCDNDFNSSSVIQLVT